MDEKLFTAFITGSRAYGVPKENSDIDLVLPLPKEVIKILRPWGEDGSNCPGSTSMKFGRLNLIIPDSPESIAVWEQGTAQLIAHGPVTRKAAMDLFHKMRRAAGIIK